MEKGRQLQPNAGRGEIWFVHRIKTSLIVVVVRILIVVVARMARACTTSRRLAASAFSTVPSSKLANA
jgi:hypothetical protein